MSPRMTIASSASLAELRSALAAERKRNDELHAEILKRVGGLLAELMRIQTERDAAVTALKLITSNIAVSGGGEADVH